MLRWRWYVSEMNPVSKQADFFMFIYCFRYWWYWRSLESNLLRWGLAAIGCCKILSRWHWCVSVGERTNVWQVILQPYRPLTILYSYNRASYPFSYICKSYLYRSCIGQSMDKWKSLVFQAAIKLPNGRQPKAYLCTQTLNRLRKMHIPNSK